jgi:molecular chaperone DnaK
MTSFKILGIDLGTTFSVMAYIDENGNAQIIPNTQGENTTPSAVWYKGESIIVGKEALAHATLEPDEVVLNIKRSMDDENYRILGHTPSEISAEILRKLKNDAEAHLGIEISRAVVTVPAYFNDRGRKATRKAGELAGLEVMALPNEPTAAAVFYGVQQMSPDTKILVYDLGGGTFDATILEYTDGTFHVRASDGSQSLGGKDWTDALLAYAAEQYENLYKVSPQENLRVYQLLRDACESAKIQLARLPVTGIELTHDGQTELLQVTIDQFNEMTADRIDQTMIRVKRALEKANLQESKVDIVLSVGGSSRLKAVQQALTDTFGKKPVSFDNPDLIVAKGAALYTTSDFSQGTSGIVIRRPDGIVVAPIQESTTHGLGIVVVDHSQGKLKFATSVIIPGGSPIPAEMNREFALPEGGEDHFNVPVIECETDGQSLYECKINWTYQFFGWSTGERPSRIDVTYKYSRDAEIDLTAVDIDRNVELDKERIPFELPELETTAQTASVMTCFDCSGSMSNKPIREAKEQFHTLLNRLIHEKKNIRMGFVSFGGRAELREPLTDELSRLKRTVDALKAHGGTPMAAALKIARDQLQGLGDTPRYVILISDGYPNDRTNTTNAANALKQDGIGLFVISIGQQGAAYLRTLGADYQEIPSAAGISDAIYQFLTTIN